MNKAVYALVCVILVLAGMGLYYEYNLFQKRSLLSDRNAQLESAIVSIAKTIEANEAPSAQLDVDIRVDKSPCDAKELSSSDITWETVLGNKYDLKFEHVPDPKNKSEQVAFVDLDKPGDDGKAKRLQLRNHLALDANGQPVPDDVNPGQFKTTGAGTAADLIDQLVDKAAQQHELLDKTRIELTAMRERIPGIVDDHNRLKKELRQEKINVEEQKEIVSKLEGEKADLEDRVAKLQGQIEELNTEITSLKDEVQAKSDELEAAREDVNAQIEKVDQLTKMLVELQNARTGQQTAQGSTSAATFTFGDKGTIAAVNNEIFTVILKLDAAALTELIGEDRAKPLPLLELAVKRPTADGKGEYIGKVQLRQYVKGKDYVIADILEDWQQNDFQVGDVVFAE